MNDIEREKNMLEQLTVARDAIRRKYQLIKQGKANLERTLNETFKPVVDPLKKLVEEADKNNSVDKTITVGKRSVKREKIKFENIFKPEAAESSHKSTDKTPYFNSTAIENDKTLQPLDTSYESAADDQEDIFNEFSNESIDTSPNKHNELELLNDSIAGDYIRLLHDKSTIKSNLDKTFGVRFVEDEYMIGNSSIQFEKDKVTVNDETYAKTPGLMELLFHREPNSKLISSLDEENYMKILEKTNAYRKKNEANGELRNKNLKKFKNFIAPHLMSPNNSRKRKSIGGSGLLPTHKIARKNTTFDYVYWDDPNELVDRLRLLIAEQAAGNPSHVNEIHSIIEELRESGYIY